MRLASPFEMGFLSSCLMRHGPDPQASSVLPRVSPVAIIVGGALKDYAWGRPDGLVPWAPASGGPQAELWFGAHPAGVSPQISGQDPRGDWPQGEPLLVKILAAGKPLSIQVHPDAGTAASLIEEGGLASGLLSDHGEKAEMLIALDHFEALAGFRPIEECIDVLQQFGMPQAATAVAGAGGYQAAVSAIFASPLRGDWRPNHVAKAAGISDGGVWSQRLGEIARDNPRDPGVAVAALLRYVVVEPGGAIYLPAGVPHTYLHGLGVEVMNASDNVLRMGLTSKLVAPDEAVRAIRGDRDVQALSPGSRLAPAGAPFAARLLAVGTGQLPQGTYRALLALQGEVGLDCAAELRPGQALLLQPEEKTCTAQVRGSAVLVTTTEARPVSAPPTKGHS